MAATITLVTPDPHLGGTVCFTVSGIPHNVKNPRVEVLAYQDGALVYGEAGSVAQATCSGTDPLGYSGFLLGGGGSLWKDGGGPASCVANLFEFDNSGKVQTYVQLATTSFEAAG